MHHRRGRVGRAVTLDRAALIALIGGQESVASLAADGRCAGEGVGDLDAFVALLDRFDFWFNIVEP